MRTSGIPTLDRVATVRLVSSDTGYLRAWRHGHPALVEKRGGSEKVQAVLVYST